ncbi:hypothetical protein BS78_01G197100 [Paspalum vaginatum]|nr:hypothetical protein BS78_01G197100 [Paspalum vaginatum]
MASAGWAWVAEVAGEELAKLEAAHPGRLGPLKAELQRLVAEPGLDAAADDDDTTSTGGATPAASSQHAPPRAGLVCTQGSSSSSSIYVPPLCVCHILAPHGRCTAHSPCEPGAAGNLFAESRSTRKRKPRGAVREREAEAGKRRRWAITPPGPAKDGAEMAIERAERCLERIRAVKRSLLAGLPLRVTGWIMQGWTKPGD